MATYTNNSFVPTLIYNEPPFKLYRKERSHSLEFTQTTLSNTWVITHNLGTYPSVTVIEEGVDGVLLGDVVYTSRNTVTITFSTTYAGTAILS